MRASKATLLLLALSLPASAQMNPHAVSSPSTDSAAAATPTLPSPSHRPVASGELRNAALISLGATAFPVLLGSWMVKDDGSGLPPALIAIGLLVGPSTGQFYLGDTGPAWFGMGLRTLGGILFSIGVAQDLSAAWNSNGSAGGVPMAIGLSLFAAGTVYSFVQPPVTHPRRPASALRFNLVPTLARKADGGLSRGLIALVGF